MKKGKGVLALTALLLLLLAPLPAHANTDTKFYLRYGSTPNSFRPAINAAAYIWSLNFHSQIPVYINVYLKSNQTIDELASGTPSHFYENFAGSKIENIYYPAAIANALANKDLTNGDGEINIYLNPAWTSEFYLGTDGHCPSNKYDLETLMIHEISHGLGLISGANDISGYGTFTKPTIYDAFIKDAKGNSIVTEPSGLALGSSLTSNLFWTGPLLTVSNNGVAPQLYTPTTFDPTSSISHFAPGETSTANLTLLYPDFSQGYVEHRVSKELKALFQDLQTTPQLGTPASLPDAPIKTSAIAGDGSISIYFQPPLTALTGQISGYQVKVLQTQKNYTSNTSPIVIPGLENGKSYSLTLTSLNALGSSLPINFSGVMPTPSWKKITLIKGANATRVVSIPDGSDNYLFYSAKKSGNLTWVKLENGKWISTVIDGPNSKINGALRDNMSGFLNYCVNTDKISGLPKFTLLYQDLTKSSLRSASWDGKKWNLETIDGDGVGQGNRPDRSKSNDDVGVSNACTITRNGLQVFYRDENLGYLIGAVKSKNNWNYEVVDGDSSDNGRTTYDVANHLAATNIGNTTYLIYDAVSSLYQDGSVSGSDIQIAVRDNTNPKEWRYATFDSSLQIPAAGYAVAAENQNHKVIATWFASSPTNYPNPDTLRLLTLSNKAITLPGSNTPLPSSYTLSNLPLINYGTPASPAAISGKYLVFKCSEGLCAYNLTSQNFGLVSNQKYLGGDNFAFFNYQGKDSLVFADQNEGGAIAIYQPN